MSNGRHGTVATHNSHRVPPALTSDTNYPRTLIVGVQFSEGSGTGTYLGQLFSGWPADRLATVCGDVAPPDWRRCRRDYRIGDLEFRLPALLRRMVPARPSGPLAPPTAQGPQPASPPPSSAASPAGASLGRRLARYPWRAMLRLLGGGEVLYRVGPSPEFLAWARSFEPEVIYGRCSSLNNVRFLRRTQQALGLPMVLHLMDDWPGSLYLGGWTSRLIRPRYLAEFAEVIRSADVVVAICREMAEEYQRRYQRPIQWLPMPVELAPYQQAARTQWTAGKPFRLRFGGRIGWAIRESLADVARAVHGMRQDGSDVAFDLVTFRPDDAPAACRTADGVTVQPPGPLADLPRLQAEADVLVVCYDFDAESFRQARYSMPGKLAECMASGTPILVYAPPGLPVVEYARREGWGRVVDRRDPEALRAAVRELMESASLREQLGQTARRLAAQRHDAQAVSDQMRSLLTSAIANNQGNHE
jgi:glycosyltransferase involved in cell wall biosynthesis